MADLMGTARRRLARVAGACVLLAGGIGASVLLGGGAAQAAACAGAPVAAPTACQLTGTLTVTAGSLTLTSPTALAWSATATGLDQQLVDATGTSFVVSDATGSGAGWHITVTATTFTNGAATLANTGTVVLNGSASAEAATTAPTAACSVSSTCTPSTAGTTYPVAIATAASTPPTTTIYSAAVNTGLGSVTLGIGANPVSWWVNAPATIRSGSYISTINLAVVTAP